MTFNIPRLMFASCKSGGGKTSISLGFIRLLMQNKYKPVSLKCGPDYIDPLFHSKLSAIPCGNLDLFFSNEDSLKKLFVENCLGADFAVIEAAMGYYDGLGGISTRASAWDIARVSKTPVVLIADAAGTSLSLSALIQGFLLYKKRSFISAVILNRCSESLYTFLKPIIEKECKIPLAGYLSYNENFKLKSCYLGLAEPESIKDFQQTINTISEGIKASINIPLLIKIALKATHIVYTRKSFPVPPVQSVRIGIAKDEAFSFYYRENLKLLEKFGAHLVYFSPLHDKIFPDCDALYIGGGYPELFAQKLSKNKPMMKSIRQAAKKGMPIFAEGGGYMYLCKDIRAKDGKKSSFCNIIADSVFYTGRSKRFGYIQLSSKEDTLLSKAGDVLFAHEFHYFDTMGGGKTFIAKKPLSAQSWSCIHSFDYAGTGMPHIFAGWPHFYFAGNPSFATNFVEAAGIYKNKGLA